MRNINRGRLSILDMARVTDLDHGSLKDVFGEFYVDLGGGRFQ